MLDAVPESDRLKFDGTPGAGEPGEYDPAGTLAHFGATSNHRDVFYAPQCSGLATNLLQCWFHKAGLNLPQSDCADEALIAYHHFHGQRNWEMFPDAGVSVPDFSTSVAARHGVIHHHLLDLYFTASLAVYGECSALESMSLKGACFSTLERTLERSAQPSPVTSAKRAIIARINVMTLTTRNRITTCYHKKRFCLLTFIIIGKK